MLCNGIWPTASGERGIDNGRGLTVAALSADYVPTPGVLRNWLIISITIFDAWCDKRPCCLRIASAAMRISAFIIAERLDCARFVAALPFDGPWLCERAGQRR
jgi:hypothetical protein